MTKYNTRQKDPTLRSGIDGSQDEREYYHQALKWFLYENWSIEEAANLFAGCLPGREMLQPGEINEQLDEKVLEAENRIRRAINNPLKAVSSNKYFAPVEISSVELMAWALAQNVPLPPLLLSAFEAQQTRDRYSTPGVEGVQWVCAEFWENVDYRAPPGQGEIVQALLQRYPELSHDECIMIEHICRHPLTRPEDNG
tara:strand:+ start:916 stop:1509 length:594 start_codon:yes stop_codon:yes gene_type:complete